MIHGRANSNRSVHQTKNNGRFEGLSASRGGQFSMFVLSTAEWGTARSPDHSARDHRFDTVDPSSAGAPVGLDFAGGGSEQVQG
jgi:hypothetical protein